MRNWKKNKINLAVQVLPESGNQVKYELVDKAIEAIKVTGLKHQVCPFETVVECTFEELSGLINKILEACENAGTQRMLTNLKIQVDFDSDVSIDEKMGKYK